MVMGGDYSARRGYNMAREWVNSSMGENWKAREGYIDPGEGTEELVEWTRGPWKGINGPYEETRGLGKGYRRSREGIRWPQDRILKIYGHVYIVR